jgi:hypothetical protein
MTQIERQTETIAKALQTADLLSGDIREAQKVACGGNAALEILLRDLMGQAMTIKNRLAELEACLR